MIGIVVMCPICTSLLSMNIEKELEKCSYHKRDPSSAQTFLETVAKGKIAK